VEVQAKKTMTTAKNLPTPAKNLIIPPNDLWSDEPPLESDLHRDQIHLLLACLKWWWQNRQDFYATGNVTIYYNPQRLTTQDFRGPDFFVVKGCENRPRRSWMLWKEGWKYPDVIVELLSDATERVDKTTKWELYQDTFGTPEYFWFHPETLEFKGWRLEQGKYKQIEANEQGMLWSQELELFLGVQEMKLRFFTPQLELVPSPEEQRDAERQQREAAQQQAEASQQQAQAERQQREAAQQRVEQLLAKLIQLGIDPDKL